MSQFIKLYDCFVCETRELKQFYFRSDADKFAASCTAKGLQVLRGLSYVER